MNIALRLCLAACVAAGASAQEKPAAGAPAPAVPQLATSKQGQSTAPVDIVITLRHVPPADGPPGHGKCEKGADCDVAEHWLVEVHDWQHNNAFLMFSMPFLVGTHLAWAIESWRARHGAAVRRWLEAVGEFEALVSLSAYRYEHPDDPFPDVVTGPERTAVFEGIALGHPLLPSARMVRNDVALNDVTRLLVVSGSNMSGKSTLLRTAGTNAVLAFAGAPVRAHSLRLSPLAIGATLRIQDSLQEGRSRFYAEITRIRELADIARGEPGDGARDHRPLFFLLDELFHGTNSHDRLVGASGVLRSLIDRGALGLVTTHDLALTAIADNLTPHAANVHFEEWFDAGEMRFDYRLKPGRVTRSNALALMRAVGLEVDTDG